MGLYLSPPENGFVISVDEKPTIQANERRVGYVYASDGELVRVVNDNYTSPSTTITLPQTGTRRNYRSGALETRFCACFPDILSV